MSNDSNEKVCILIEILNAKDLLVADKTTSDPYVKIKMGKNNLHETKHVSKNLNPVYTGGHNNSYVLSCTKKELSMHSDAAITFKVKDWNRFTTNNGIGHVDITEDEILNLYDSTLVKKQPITKSYNIIPPQNQIRNHDHAGGTLTIRFKIPTEQDVNNSHHHTAHTGTGFFGNLLRKKEPTKEYGPPDLHLLIEIVSCGGLFAADIGNTSDPYVMVKVGNKDVHQTLYKPKTVDPIYTIASNSLFILDVATQELIDSNGLFFRIRDYDVISRDDELGYTYVSATTVLESKGDRTEFRLTPPTPPTEIEGEEEEKRNSEIDAGYLSLRIRPATQYDKDFLQHAAAKDLDTFLNVQHFDKKMEATRVRKIGLPRRDKYKTKKTDEDGIEKNLVRPHPDPENPSETTWMTDEEIDIACWKPSKNWIEVGSGDLGRVYLEIMGAHGLPDLDPGVDNKTDPFLSIVYEDCVIRTEEIDNCLSPRFLPWTRRAYMLRMMNISSSLYIGVFDSDNDGKSNDFIGQASIELSNLCPGTDYTLEYDLYKNKNANRSPLGTVTVRLRFELEDTKQLVLSKLQMPSDLYVSANYQADFDMIQKTIYGADSMLEYGGKAFFSQVLAELSSYTHCQIYIVDAVMSLVFWRGQVPLPIWGHYIPLHSFILFYMATTLVENWGLYPSYFFFSIAWLLLSIQVYNNCRPNPWTKKKSFVGIMKMVALGNGDVDNISLDNLTVGYLQRESEGLGKSFKERIDTSLRASTRQNELFQQHATQVEEVGDQVADTNISSSNNKLSLDLLKPILYPIQLQIVPLMNYLRFVRNVVLWNEPYYTFIITVVSLILGAVCWIIPWGFFVRWTGRFVAWIVLGPHMKLVDVFWYSKRVVDQDDSIKQQQVQFKALLDQAKANAKIARLQKEDAEKLRDMKGAIFGKYLSKVPQLCTDLYVGHPKYTSEAKPYIQPQGEENKNSSLFSFSEHIHGQKLVGDMIPKLASASIEVTKHGTTVEKGKKEKKYD